MYNPLSENNVKKLFIILVILISAASLFGIGKIYAMARKKGGKCGKGGKGGGC